MNILLVSNYYYPQHIGGVEVVSYNLVNYYRKAGQNVHWVAANVPPTFREDSDQDIPIRAWNITEEKLGFPHPIPHPNVLLKLYKQTKWCEIVHMQDALYPINVLSFILAKLLHKPILITQYARIIPYKRLYKRLMQILAYQTIGRLMFSTADEVVFITTNVRDNMRHLITNKDLDIVPLGVDTDFYTPLNYLDREKIREGLSGDVRIPIILFVGRMVERKGVHLLQPLIIKHPEWHWVLVGRPDDFCPGDWQLSNTTYFQIVSDDSLRNLYSAADLLVHPSTGEGITLIVAECMACGTPVVISEESLHEVDEADRKLFFPTFPETDQIETAILNAFDRDIPLMRGNIRAYALKRLSWGRMVDQYMSILKEIMLANE